MKINYEVLEYLRKKTKLNRKDKKMLNDLENSIEELITEFNKMEHSDFGTYSSRIDIIEYELRRNILEKKLFLQYITSGETKSLPEYTEYIINEEMKKEKQSKKKEIIKKMYQRKK